MNRLLLALYLILISCLLMIIVACSETEPPPEDRVESQFVEGAVNIGYIHGSPDYLRNSASLAASHINTAGGVLGQPFNIIYNRGDSNQKSQEKAVTMMDDHGIQAIVSTTSSRSLAILEETKARKVLQISETATSPRLTTADDNDFLFRTAPSDVHQGKVLARMAYENGAKKAVFVVNAGDAYGTGLATEFENELINLGCEFIKIVEIPIDVTVGFDDYFPQIFEPEPDVVVVALLGASLNANLINETVNYHYQGFYLFPDVAVNTSFTNNVADPSIIPKAFGVSPAEGLLTSEHYQTFAQSYQQAFGVETENYSASVYDSIMIVGLAIEHAGLINQTSSPSGEMIKNSMRMVMNPEGAEVGPSNINQAFQLVRQGQAIDYHGAYSNTDFDQNGDIAGTLVYDTFSFDNQTGEFDLIEQIIIEIPLDE